MAQAYFGTRLSPHMSQTPEGYLICHDVPINRTGSQTYLAHELELSGDPNRPVTVSRHEEDVFHPAALASFEGKDVTWLHPDAFLTPENQARYSKGHVSNVRRVGEATVADLVAADFPRRQLFPAGRLDKTSTGFVLLTDDGAFAHDILAPGRHVSKEYIVTLDTPLTAGMQAGFAAGVTLADGQTMDPAEAEPFGEDPCVVKVILHQGVYHQIKRMFGVYGAGVNALHRTAIGPVALDKALEPGAWRPLTAEEVEALRRAAQR